MEGFIHGLVAALSSIKTRVTLAAVGVLAVGIGLTSLLLVRDAERATVRAHRDSELREVVRSAELLSSRVVAMQRALEATAELLDASTLTDPQRLAAFLASQPVLRGMFANVFAANADGKLLALAEPGGVRHPLLLLNDRDYFRKTVTEQRPIISGSIPGRLSNEPVVILTYPLRNAGGVYGVIGGALRLASRDLLEDLIDDRNDGSSSHVVVTDAHGTILAHPERGRISKSISIEPRMSEGYAAWLMAGGASGGAVEPSGLFLEQPGEMLVVAGVAGPDWLVWRAHSESDVLAPLRAARAKATLWATAIVLLASLLVLALIGSLLRPLGHLQRRAASLFTGPEEVHSGWPEVGGEIGELSRVLRHVSAERAQLERFNAQVMAQLGSVMAAAPLGIIFTRAQRFELLSAEACRLLGRSEDELLGQKASMIYASADDYAALGPQVGAAFAVGQPYLGEWRFVRPDGGEFWGQLRGQPVEAGNPAAGTIWTLADVNEHVEARQQLEWSATHDALTGLGNRKLFERLLSRAVDARPTSLPAALLMIDLDRFKPINDSAGHAAGDAMLQAVAVAIQSQVRGHDLVARLGGDEFAVLLEDCPHDAAMRVAQKVQAAIARAELNWEGRVLSVGASIGIASLSTATAGIAGWMREADVACYEAKASGRGAVRVAGNHTLRLVSGSEAV